MWSINRVTFGITPVHQHLFFSILGANRVLLSVLLHFYNVRFCLYNTNSFPDLKNHFKTSYCYDVFSECEVSCEVTAHENFERIMRFIIKRVIHLWLIYNITSCAK